MVYRDHATLLFLLESACYINCSSGPESRQTYPDMMTSYKCKSSLLILIHGQTWPFRFDLKPAWLKLLFHQRCTKQIDLGRHTIALWSEEPPAETTVASLYHSGILTKSLSKMALFLVGLLISCFMRSNERMALSFS